jgi:hypothetical protein
VLGFSARSTSFELWLVTISIAFPITSQGASIGGV